MLYIAIITIQRQKTEKEYLNSRVVTQQVKAQ